MKIWESFLDLLFPPKCPFCRNILDDPRAPVCPECQGKLPWLLGEDALRAVEGTAGCLSPLAYRDGVPEAVRRYKFPGNPSYGKPFGLPGRGARGGAPVQISGKSQLWEALRASHGSVRPGPPDRRGGCGDLGPAEPEAEEKTGL